MTYDQWFKSQQGIPYDGSYLFAEAAWKAAQRQAYERAAEVCDGIGFDGDTMGMSYANGCAIAIRALIEGDSK